MSWSRLSSRSATSSAPQLKCGTSSRATNAIGSLDFQAHGLSNTWIKAPALASCATPPSQKVVSEALLHFDERRYRLFAWCVMPNHVHVVVRLFPGYSLAAVLHSWKSYTAKRAADVIGITGSIWQREYYDHLLRSEGEFERAVRYVVENPVKAGLRNWPWAWARGQDALVTAGEAPALQG
jgi:REP element-mobilizing transposase RayT